MKIKGVEDEEAALHEVEASLDEEFWGMKKIIIFENRGETKEPKIEDMEQGIFEGDPYEVARLDTWDEARAYLAERPGRYWTESTFSGRVTIAEGCFALECILDEDGEIVETLDCEFCKLEER